MVLIEAKREQLREWKGYWRRGESRGDRRYGGGRERESHQDNYFSYNCLTTDPRLMTQFSVIICPVQMLLM